MHPTAAGLVERAAAGDRAAADALVRLLRPFVRYAFSRALGGWPEARATLDLDDLEQELWLTLLKDEGRQLRAYLPERASPERYLHLICRRVLTNELRRRRRQRALLLQAEREPITDIERTLQARDSLARLLALLEPRLPSTARRVLWRTLSGGGTPEHISRDLGLNTQTVYNWQHKIRTLARAYQELLPDGLGAGAVP